MLFTTELRRVLGAATVLLLTTSQIAAAFSPPQVFKNTNLLRTIDVSKGYVQQTIAVIIENTSERPQSEYFLPISQDELARVSYVAAKDKKEGTTFTTSLVTEDPTSETQHYKVTLGTPLASKGTLTLQISIGLIDGLEPQPKEIAQAEKQFLRYDGLKYSPSAYPTDKQKTKLKFPNNEVLDYKTFPAKSDGTADPTKSGATLSYGTYESVSSSEQASISARFEYTAPVIQVDRLERDIEVSHWGGNVATEERYWVTNAGAKLKGQFSRVTWATTAYYNPPTAAIKGFVFNLIPGSKDAYFTDEIGNVSTSRFRSNHREAHLDLKPRYPIFGGWNYSFVVGWNNELGSFLRKVKGDQYVIKVPFLEGPREVATYKHVEVTIILPEGASNIEYNSPVVPKSVDQYLHKTFLDTVGRTALKLTVENVVDELRNQDLIITYHYSAIAALRKPIVVMVATLTVYLVSLVLGSIDISIGK